ncbi:MAG: Ig-like domain-containing protein [Cyclobacteriaceae bacterium]|nr:Ig-like domain-containing protein [Cyclobacteriaceae bacterium]MCH8515312.1 Ig-like domain-containing protein [Cyclobacteriaceae bacterium]
MPQQIKTYLIDLFAVSIILIAVFTIASCATQIPPDGGPKDTIPPVLIKSNPKDQSRNFQGNDMTFEFNEYINADKLKDQLLISPRTEANYNSKIKKNTLIIEFEEKLEDSTTYTFNFREGVTDITEKTSAVNLVVAFSTGPDLDSMSIEGNVYDPLTGKPIDEAVIGLYKETDTLDIFTGKPLYFTKSKEEGDFVIRNIRSGNYLLYATEDDNNSLTANPEKDKYGFVPNVIQLDTITKTFRIPLVQNNIKPIELRRARARGPYYEISFSKGLESFRFLESTNMFASLHESNSLARLYNIFGEIDSIYFEMEAIDSLGNSILLKDYAKFGQYRRDPPPMQIKVEPKDKAKVNENNGITIQFDKPVRTITKDSIYIMVDSLNIIRYDSLYPQWNYNRTALKLQYRISKKQLTQIKGEEFERNMIQYSIDSAAWIVRNPPLEEAEEEATQLPKQAQKRNTSKPTKEEGIDPKPKKPTLDDGYRLFIGEGAFISVEKDTSESDVIKYTLKNEDDFGMISGKVNINTEHPYIIQLVDSKFKVVDEIYNKSTYTFDWLRPTKYRIRVIIDKNNNQKWDAGDITKGENPEPIYVHDLEIEVRANWEIGGIDITISDVDNL